MEYIYFIYVYTCLYIFIYILIKFVIEYYMHTSDLICRLIFLLNPTIF